MAGLSENFHEGRNCSCSFQSWNGAPERQQFLPFATVTIGFMINSTHLDTWALSTTRPTRLSSTSSPAPTYLAGRRRGKEARTSCLFNSTHFIKRFSKGLRETRAWYFSLLRIDTRIGFWNCNIIIQISDFILEKYWMFDVLIVLVRRKVQLKGRRKLINLSLKISDNLRSILSRKKFYQK